MKVVRQMPYRSPQRESGAIPIPTREEIDICRISGADGKPSIKHWFDPMPEMFSAGEESVRDRASGAVFSRTRQPLNSGGNSFTFSEHSGAPVVASRYNRFGSFDNKYDEFSFFAFIIPIRDDEEPANGDVIFGDYVTGSNIKSTVRIRRSNGNIEFAGNTSVRTRAGDLYDTPSIIALTYSMENGVGLHRNGVYVDGDSEWVAPSESVPTYFLGRTPGSALFNGVAGAQIFLDIDVSKDEHQEALRKMWNYYFRRYGIDP